jgi:antitoxin VapB
MSFPVLNQPVNPVTELSQQAADLDPNTMTPEKIAQVMLAAPLVRQMIEAVEEEALRRLKAGQTIPGLKVVHGRGSRSWALPEDEMADKLIKMGIPKSAVYETKLVTVAKVEKLARATGLTKTAVVELAIDRLAIEIQDATNPRRTGARMVALMAQLDRVPERADALDPLVWMAEPAAAPSRNKLPELVIGAL